ncbi:hypothetical protein DNX92_14140 [Salmonella enterica subsp. enterica]|nr:hypothetical protein [Salmonella enterica subsp. enterica serovar Richmond]
MDIFLDTSDNQFMSKLEISEAPVVRVMTRCEYFKVGIMSLFNGQNVAFDFFGCIDDLVIEDDEPLLMLLVLDMSGTSSLGEFKAAMDFLNQYPGSRRLGVLVSRYNAYMTHYISRKFRGRVTFFNSHNLISGLFYRNFLSWLNGKTFRPMHAVARFRDSRYGFSLKEWISLVVPMSGESIQEMSDCLGLSTQALYQVRQNALKKIGLKSYREFCELYMKGVIRTENDRLGFSFLNDSGGLLAKNVVNSRQMLAERGGKKLGLL